MRMCAQPARTTRRRLPEERRADAQPSVRRAWCSSACPCRAPMGSNGRSVQRAVCGAVQHIYSMPCAVESNHWHLQKTSVVPCAVEIQPLADECGAVCRGIQPLALTKRRVWVWGGGRPGLPGARSRAAAGRPPRGRRRSRRGSWPANIKDEQRFRSSGVVLRMAAPYKRHGGNGATRSLRVRNTYEIGNKRGGLDGPSRAPAARPPRPWRPALFQPHSKVRARPGPSGEALCMAASCKRHAVNDATRSLRV